MRVSAPLLTIAGTVAGTAAAVVAYQSGASVGSSGTEPASVKTDLPAAATTSWLPCEDGWKLVGKACVKVKQKVVVVHDLPAPAAPQAQSAGVRSSTHSADDEADGHEAEHGDEVEHGEDEADHEDDSSEDVEHSSDEPDHEDVGSDD